MMRWIAPALLIGVGCSDYGFNKPPTSPELSDTDTDTDSDSDSDTDSDADSDTDADSDADADTDPLVCGDFDFSWSWVASIQFAEQADPVDGSGRAWYELSYDTSGFFPVSVPHQDIPVGNDRIYITDFDLSVLPNQLELDLQTDDGLVLYVNGDLVGQYGGPWQQEGCVNELANCINTIAVDPVDITPNLLIGSNRISARVSNPVANAYFELIPVCTDP